ncbi:MAG: tRNA (guanosine(37)-N1)-methyltransferase TrmD [Propionibacteriaceae bacterium]|jgi:tRNA (guanine37-N1)-methyltransferase|nr:tRNA (guanosine(37)-N1)-methyltransferase TrmD [Propionibacteriaceae bacterium]
MRIDVVTIFCEYFEPLRLSLLGKAIDSGVISLGVHDLRDWTHDRHRTVDDTPYGGGAGMVMKPEPWGEALDAICFGGRSEPGGVAGCGGTSGESGPRDRAAEAADGPRERAWEGREVDAAAGAVAAPTLIVPTPAGRPFTQAMAADLSRREHLVFACGRYEGIDQRVVEYAAARMEVVEVSLGDYVLNGGEVAALAIIEAVARLIPGVIGNPASLVEESHSEEFGLLEYPVYTKPASWRGLDVPEVLLSGHHGEVAKWRRGQAEERTRRNRPDLLG